MDATLLKYIVDGSNILSAVFWFLAVIISLKTLKQIQKLTINIVDNSQNFHSSSSAMPHTEGMQDNRGTGNRIAAGNYSEMNIQWHE
jgi:hypothetical protein